MDISFIIPAYNEEDHIEEVLRSIRTAMSDNDLSYEIIVVDDASTDNTLNIIEKIDGISVINMKVKRFPSIVRNLGVLSSKGNVLVFLDGDVILDPSWGAAIDACFDYININETQIVTGSTVSVPDNAGWLERVWFTPMQDRQRKYINSGHLIVSRELFDLVFFDPDLESGEDSDFGLRAIEQGATIENNRAFEAIHLGYPKTIKDFIKREIWHGMGNFKLDRIHERVPTVILLLWGLLIGSVVVSFYNAYALLIFPTIFIILSILYAIDRCRKFTFDIIPCTFLSGLFFTGRMTAAAKVFWKFITRVS